MPIIEVLDPDETAEALSGTRAGGSELLTQVADRLMGVVDTKASVYVEGLNESSLNALRTKMYRRDIKIAARKVHRNGKVGHVLTVTSDK